MALARRILILGASSDIGEYLAHHFLSGGNQVWGSYRQHNAGLLGLQKRGAILMQANLMSEDSVAAFVAAFSASGAEWDTIISAIGQLSPIGPFFSIEFGAWADSVTVNALAQLRVIHALFPIRNQQRPSKIIFFAGGGTNGPFDRYSAYCVGKLLLIKMCELLHSEYPQIHASILGTGWVDTKIHRQSLEAGPAAGPNYQRTLDFIAQAADRGTSMATVAECIDWCLTAPPEAVAGRNFSVVHDPWRDPAFIDALTQNADLCKLRRAQ